MTGVEFDGTSTLCGGGGPVIVRIVKVRCGEDPRLDGEDVGWLTSGEMERVGKVNPYERYPTRTKRKESKNLVCNDGASNYIQVDVLSKTSICLFVTEILPPEVGISSLRTPVSATLQTGYTRSAC